MRVAEGAYTILIDRVLRHNLSVFKLSMLIRVLAIDRVRDYAEVAVKKRELNYVAKGINRVLDCLSKGAQLERRE